MRVRNAVRQKQCGRFVRSLLLLLDFDRTTRNALHTHTHTRNRTHSHMARIRNQRAAICCCGRCCVEAEKNASDLRNLLQLQQRQRQRQQ